MNPLIEGAVKVREAHLRITIVRKAFKNTSKDEIT